MSTETQEAMEMSTKPTPQHEWLKKLHGNWRVESEMMMPDGSTVQGNGTETCRDFGGLWAYSEGKSSMPDGSDMNYRFGLGFDVTFNEYRGYMMMDASSHLWKYNGSLSADGNVMTLDCEGPNMMGEGTAMYRDTITLIDENHRTLTSSGQGPDGQWVTFMTAHYTRM
ncbi:MAG: DUF1579 domain-containing protein [Armatimonadetes bacterium]|nr:DUF1579 domain-containing protein [Armatimonadota bacterium]